MYCKKKYRIHRRNWKNKLAILGGEIVWCVYEYASKNERKVRLQIIFEDLKRAGQSSGRDKATRLHFVKKMVYEDKGVQSTNFMSEIAHA